MKITGSGFVPDFPLQINQFSGVKDADCLPCAAQVEAQPVIERTD